MEEELMTDGTEPQLDGADAEISKEDGDAAKDAEAKVDDQKPDAAAEIRLTTEADTLAEAGIIADKERYVELRAMGLSLREAAKITATKPTDSELCSHLTSGVPGGARSPKSAMTPLELEATRSLFEGLSDREIHALYKKVTR